MRRVRLATAALAAALLVLCCPSLASAHATLEGTVPASGGTVAQAPGTVEARFDEPVEGAFGALRVFDASGKRVDRGKPFHPGGDATRLAVKVDDGLRGGATATYRVVSADGHVVSGGWTFAVGAAGTAQGESVARLLAGSGRSTGPVTSTAFSVVRALQYASIAVVAGGVLFLLVVWLPALRAASGAEDAWRRASRAYVQRTRSVLSAGAGVGLLSAAAAVWLEGATAAGVPAWRAFDPDVLDNVLHTRFGTMWGIAAVAWLLVQGLLVVLLDPARARVPALRPATVGAAGLAAPRSPARAELALLAVPLGFLILLPALGGHASTQHPAGVLVAANVLHIAAMSAWVGGLLALAVLLPAALRRLDGADRGRLLAAALARFSPVALGCVILLAATGVLQALFEVRSFPHLVDTAFGRAVLVKIVLLLGLIGLGALQRQRNVPRLERIAAGGREPGRAGGVVRRALAAELVLLVAVLGATGALSGYAPSTAEAGGGGPGAAAAGPFEGTATAGPVRVEARVAPAAVGANAVSLTLRNLHGGTPFTRAKEVGVDATLPSRGIGPIHLQARRVGPGRYRVARASLGVAGDWRLQITVRVSDFDEYLTKLEVPIR